MKNKLLEHKLIRQLIPILASNLIVYLLVADTSKPQVIKKREWARPRTGFTHIKVNLVPFIPLNNRIDPVPISIYSHQKKLLIAKAYLIPHQFQVNKNSDPVTPGKPQSKEFVVEIPNSKIKSIIRHNDLVLFAYPPTTSSSATSPIKKRIRSYELVF